MHYAPTFYGRAVLLALSMACTLTGCFGHSGPNKLYLLQVDNNAVLAQENDPAATQKLHALGVGPVRMAGYLDRVEILLADGQDSMIRMRDADQWSEPLKEGFTRTLTLDLQQQMPTAHVTSYPWGRSMTPDLQLDINVEQFHLNRSNGKGLLIVDWSVLRGEESIYRQRSAISMQANPEDTTSVVSAMSTAIARLSRVLTPQINPLLNHR